MAAPRSKDRAADDDQPGKGRRKSAQKPTRRPPGSGSFKDTATGVRYHCPTGRTASGQTVYKDFYGRTKEEAIAKAEAWKAAHPQGPPSSDASQSLEAYLATWLRVEVQPQNAISTLESYADTIDLHVTPRIGMHRLCDLSTLVLQAWVNELGARRTTGYAYSIVRAALNTAVKWGILDKNPADHVTVPKYKARKAQALTISQVRALIAAAAGQLDVRQPIVRKSKNPRYNGRTMKPIALGTRYALLYMLYIALGTRRGELLALRWSDLDLEAGTVNIERSLDKHRRERETKTETSERLLYLDPVLVDALKAHRAMLLGEAHDEGRKPDGLVFPTENGTAIIPDNLRRHFKLVCAAAGLPATIRIHDLRHTAASLMLAKGNQLTAVSKTLGHSSTVVTGQIYAHGYEEDKRRATASVVKALREGGHDQ